MNTPLDICFYYKILYINFYYLYFLFLIKSTFFLKCSKELIVINFMIILFNISFSVIYLFQ